MRLLLALLLTLPLAAEINVDPGEDLGTRAARRTARVTAWEAQWAGLSQANKDNAAYNAYVDWAKPKQGCLAAGIRQRMGDPDADAAEIKAWVVDRMGAVANQSIEFIQTNCPGNQSYTYTSTTGDQGELSEKKIIVIRGDAVHSGLRQALPFFPRILNVPPFALSAGAKGACTLKGNTSACVGGVDCCYAHEYHLLHEAHVDFLQSIVQAEGVLSRFDLVADKDEVGWVGYSEGP